MDDGVLSDFGYPQPGNRLSDAFVIRSDHTTQIFGIEPCRERGLLRFGEGWVTGEAIDASTRLFGRGHGHGTSGSFG
jgi:hypothetical protein